MLFNNNRRSTTTRLNATDDDNDANNNNNNNSNNKESYDVPESEDPLPWNTTTSSQSSSAKNSNTTNDDDLALTKKTPTTTSSSLISATGNAFTNVVRKKDADSNQGTMSSFNLPMKKETIVIPANKQKQYADEEEEEEENNYNNNDNGEEDSIMNEMKNTHVFLPISYYQILDLSPARATKLTIPKAGEAMKYSEVFESFSNSLRQSRVSLIEEAVAVLTDPEARAYHDQDLNNGVMTPVDFERAPAALAFLLESGENEKVLEFGDAILTAKNKRGGNAVNNDGKRDIALASAMATCEYAQEALHSLGKRPSYVEGCDMMELALKTLEKAPGGKSRSFAPELKDAIYKELDDALPGVALELLALPLEQTRERELGLKALKKCLWTKTTAADEAAVLISEKDGDASLISKADLQVQCSRFLTAYEHASMFVEAPDHVPADPEEVYRASISHIVAALMSGNPLLLVDADEILQQLEIAAKNTNQTSEIGNVTIERAVCLVLLGKTDAACELLDVSSEESISEMANFVRQNSPSGDAVEGVCVLVDQWIEQVAFPLFRDSARIVPISLEQWFSNPKIMSFVDRYALSSAFAKIEGAGSAAKRALSKGTSNVFGTFFPSDDVPLALRKNVLQYRFGVIARFAFAGAIVFSGLNFFNGNVNANVNVFKNFKMPSLSRSSTSSNSSSSATMKKAKEQQQQQQQQQQTKKNANNLNRGGINNSLKPPLQFAKPNIPKIEVPKIEIPKISVPSISLPKPTKKPMDESTAESVVMKWQKIKAKALGSSHDSRSLSTILDGPMLRQWTLRAEDVASHGWAWEYELLKLAIEKIEIYNEDEAIVEVRLTELAVLKDRSKVDDDDVYESTYRARYEIKRNSEGQWKIFGGSIVY